MSRILKMRMIKPIDQNQLCKHDLSRTFLSDQPSLKYIHSITPIELNYIASATADNNVLFQLLQKIIHRFCSEAEERFALKSRSVRVLCSSPALEDFAFCFQMSGDMIEKLIAICSSCHLNITVSSSTFYAGLGSSDWKRITLNTHGNTNIHAYKQACYLEKIYGGCSEHVFRSPSSAHQTELIAAFPVFGMLHFLSELDAEEGE
ncbi:hypothetical protein DPX16_10131 [Anabarilius grahami]|uniref:Uncharacterized protein n=1 Tax=Anabarilius grahami TaxID=495550 RepID=A0A3N0XXI2_ANAGA|nr:hypothetical protein DPX16_10131 [Anabarilius grahami]